MMGDLVERRLLVIFIALAAGLVVLLGILIAVSIEVVYQYSLSWNFQKGTCSLIKAEEIRQAYCGDSTFPCHLISVRGTIGGAAASTSYEYRLFENEGLLRWDNKCAFKPEWCHRKSYSENKRLIEQWIADLHSGDFGCELSQELKPAIAIFRREFDKAGGVLAAVIPSTLLLLDIIALAFIVFRWYRHRYPSEAELRRREEAAHKQPLQSPPPAPDVIPASVYSGSSVGRRSGSGVTGKNRRGAAKRTPAPNEASGTRPGSETPTKMVEGDADTPTRRNGDGVKPRDLSRELACRPASGSGGGGGPRRPGGARKAPGARPTHSTSSSRGPPPPRESERRV